MLSPGVTHCGLSPRSPHTARHEKHRPPPITAPAELDPQSRQGRLQSLAHAVTAEPGVRLSGAERTSVMLIACAKAGDILGAGWSHWPWATAIAPTPTRAATVASGRDVEAQVFLTPRGGADAGAQQQWPCGVKHCLVIMLSLQVLLLLFAPQLITRLQQQRNIGGIPLSASSNAAHRNAVLPITAADASEPHSGLVGVQTPITAALKKITPASAAPSIRAAPASPFRANVSAFEQCSSARIASVTASLYTSCPILSRDWTALESVGSVLRRSGGLFTTRTKSDPSSPLQAFENICLQGGGRRGQYTAWVIVGAGPATGPASRPLSGHKPGSRPGPAKPRSNANLTASEADDEERETAASQETLDRLGLFAEPATSGGPQQQQYRWRRRRLPPSHWKFLPGTTIHHASGSKAQFGPALLDRVRMGMTGTLMPQCAGLKHPVDQILVDNGCADHTHARQLPGAQNSNRSDARDALASNSSLPADLVCPLHQAGTAAARWALRLSVLDPQTLPEPPRFDTRLVAPLPPIRRRANSSSVHFVTLHEAVPDAPLSDGSGRLGPSTCPATELTGLCFERFVLPVPAPVAVAGPHKGSRNSSRGEDESREWLHRFRNATFRALQLPEPFLVLPGAAAPRRAASSSPGAKGSITRVPRVLLYGREDRRRRRWVDVERTRAALQSLHDAGRISLSFEPRLARLQDSFCGLVRLFSQSDVVVMPHGSAVSAAVWSPEGALLIEISPEGSAADSWTGLFQRELGLRVKRLVGATERSSGRGRPQFRQDGDFSADPALVLEQLVAVGIDVSAARKRNQSARLA